MVGVPLHSFQSCHLAMFISMQTSHSFFAVMSCILLYVTLILDGSLSVAAPRQSSHPELGAGIESLPRAIRFLRPNQGNLCGDTTHGKFPFSEVGHEPSQVVHTTSGRLSPPIWHSNWHAAP